MNVLRDAKCEFLFPHWVHSLLWIGIFLLHFSTILPFLESETVGLSGCGQPSGTHWCGTVPLRLSTWPVCRVTFIAAGSLVLLGGCFIKVWTRHSGLLRTTADRPTGYIDWSSTYRGMDMCVDSGLTNWWKLLMIKEWCYFCFCLSHVCLVLVQMIYFW